MRVILLIALLLPPPFYAQDPLLMDVRANIGIAFEDEAVCNRLYTQFTKDDLKDNILLGGYMGALRIAKSKHRSNLMKKLGLFNDGKEMLESAILKDPKNIELRFLRFTIQVNVPGFLFYNDDLENDRDLIEKNLHTMQNEPLRKRIAAFIAKAESDGKI